MDTLSEWLATIPDLDNRARATEVIDWVKDTYPQLTFAIKWNQPMFMDHGTFIISFSPAKKHLACAPEGAVVEHYAQRLEAEGIDHGAKFLRFPWTKPFPFDLVKDIIDYNIATKQNVTSFWWP